MQNINKKKRKLRRKKKTTKAQLAPLILVMCACITWDNGVYESFGLLENVFGLISTSRTKLNRKIQRT